ncbi:MAG TPA: multicopper oxidase domain-containing protein [Longimicrobium sp.]|nr:multicopper oxidase domain-containing protein [Longimicrobium sp.]
MIHRSSVPPSAGALPRGAPRFPSVLPSLAVAALAAGVLAACAGAGAGTAAPGAPLGASPASADSTVFPEPIVITTGANGILDVTLRVDTATLPVPGAGNQLLRAWTLVEANGVSYDTTAYPGPTFVVSPGDSVRILLVNNLPAPDDNETCVPYPAFAEGIDQYQDCFHGFNWTNIHYHGFHVTPDSTGDDVLLQIAPGQQYQYAFGIPENQSPGTHWYHPHKHGSVAIQVGNGMSGAFIVRGGALDSLTRALGMREHVIAVQKVDSQLNLIDNAFSGSTLVNGAAAPVITMRPGEVQRWRIVDENITKTANFEISFSNEDGPEPLLYDVARDGVQYAPANYTTSTPDLALLMSPGNRLDVFVQAPTEAGTDLVQVRSVANGRRRPSTGLAASSAAAPAPLFYVRVVDDGAPVNTTLPSALPPLPSFLANLPGPLDPSQIDTSQIPTIVFLDSVPAAGNSVTNPSRFYLGTAQNPFQRYNDSVVYIPESSTGQQQPMLLGGLQTWMVKNYGTATNHPFHIHINPFQVIGAFAPNPADPNAALYTQLNGASQQNSAPIWLDVVPLPLPLIDTVGGVVDTIPGYVIIRQQYEDFTGQYVMHCHILGHEERGMMQVLQVFSNAQAAEAAAQAGYPHAGHGAHTGHGAAQPAAGSGAGGGNGRGGGGGGPGSGQGRPHQH